MTSGAERAVGLEGDAALVARLEQLAAELVRAELNLVDDGRARGAGEHLVELLDAEVRDADRAREATVLRLLHFGPRPGRAGLRPVDDVEVAVVEAEPLETSLRLRDRIVAARVEL